MVVCTYVGIQADAPFQFKQRLNYEALTALNKTNTIFG